VLAATGTPDTTPPPTDLSRSTSGPSGDAWRLVLLVMAGVIGALLLLTPAAAAKRNRR
jgi:hypothetical protein